MKDAIDKKVELLEKKYNLELKKLKSKYDAKINEVTADYKKDDEGERYTLKFDLKKNTVVSSQYGFVHNNEGPCNKWSKKSDWFIVEIEDYGTFTTCTDGCYGDYDEYAMFRVIKRYEVCPKCGRMVRLTTKKFEHGPSKTRHEDVKGFSIRPDGWQPKVTVIRKNR